MREKNLGITVKKEDFSEWYSQVIQKADLADIRFGIQGFIVHKPWGFFIIKKIYEYLEEEVEKQGHQQFLFPIAVKEEHLKKEKEHAGFTPNVFWVSEAGNKKIEERFALRPTGEAQIYPLYALWLRSYKELPFKGYQSRISVFRNEMTTRPFLRGREFLFFEAHDVFMSHQEALQQIQLDLETCKKIIYGKIKIPFLYFKRPKWDTFKGADNTFTPDTLMPDGKRNQLASTHDLGQNFSQAYGIKVKDRGEKEQFVWQTCFGPGIWRIMAALIGIHGDDNGLVIPFGMAPVQIIIIPITFAQKKEESELVMKLCKNIEKEISGLGYRVKYDNRDDSPGSKYHQWELQGVPLRIEIGPKEVKSKSVMVALRTGGKESVKASDLKKTIRLLAEKVDRYIQKKADAYFKDNSRNASSLKEIQEILKQHRGFIRVPFCSIEKEGEACADVLKEKTDGAYVCGILYPEEEKVKKGSICAICKKKAQHIVYVVKSY